MMERESDIIQSKLTDPATARSGQTLRELAHRVDQLVSLSHTINNSPEYYGMIWWTTKDAHQAAKDYELGTLTEEEAEKVMLSAEDRLSECSDQQWELIRQEILHVIENRKDNEQLDPYQR